MLSWLRDHPQNLAEVHRYASQGVHGPVQRPATLVQESENPDDADAVLIVVDGRPVGYVDRHLAATCAPALRSLRAQGVDVEVPVVLHGPGQASVGFPHPASLAAGQQAPSAPVAGGSAPVNQGGVTVVNTMSGPAGAGYAPGPPKSFAAAILLSLFLGTLGVDRFYLGHVGLGVAKLLLSWMTFGIWQLIDLIVIICKGTPALRAIRWE